MSNLLKIELPKWPQMLVTGQKITPEQAFEIILKTDYFLTDTSKYSGGNRHEYNQWYREISELNTHEDNYDFSRLLRNTIGYIETNYVDNEWASCSYIYGAHGWCHPSGRIHFEDNVGKWPSVSEILNDWEQLAVAFPYLKLDVTLMNGERCTENTKPLVNIHVEHGQAQLVEPDASIHQYQYSEEKEDMRYDTRNECGLPHDWVLRYAAIVKEAITELEG